MLSCGAGRRTRMTGRCRGERSPTLTPPVVLRRFGQCRATTTRLEASPDGPLSLSVSTSKSYHPRVHGVCGGPRPPLRKSRDHSPVRDQTHAPLPAGGAVARQAAAGRRLPVVRDVRLRGRGGRPMHGAGPARSVDFSGSTRSPYRSRRPSVRPHPSDSAGNVVQGGYRVPAPCRSSRCGRRSSPSRPTCSGDGLTEPAVSGRFGAASGLRVVPERVRRPGRYGQLSRRRPPASRRPTPPDRTA